MMPCYERCAEALRMPQWLGVGEDFQDGFFAGMAVLACLVLLVALVIRLLVGGRRPAGIEIRNPHGDMLITTAAVREFVTRVIHEFEGVRLRNLRLRTVGKVVELTMEIGVDTGSALPALRDAIQSRVASSTQDKLGLDQPPKIRLVVRSLRGEQQGDSGNSQPGKRLPAKGDEDDELLGI